MSTEARALEWIVKLLGGLGIPFQTAGGLAARAYGAKRELVDFDFYVPTSRLAQVAAAAKEHLVRPGAHHKDKNWDISFMTLEYDGQRIELGGADGARHFDRQRGVWVDVKVDFAQSVPRDVFGIEIPVMPFEQLVAYKGALNRKVDRRDLMEMEPW